MKFRTEIEVRPLQHSIDYGQQIVSLGSCFADNMARRLKECKFNVVASPTGILFNPASIGNAVDMMLSQRKITPQELISSNDEYFSYDFHSSLSGASIEEALERMNRAIMVGGEALRRADHVIITLGTAWVYRLKSTGNVVANCHKQPHALFSRERLSVAEIVDILQRTISQLEHRPQIILTLSPVRHIGEGAEDNSLSKAILRVAIDELCRTNDNVTYFAAYELLMDDLRDYRFYADDLVHPSSAAVEYISCKFFDAALSPHAKETMEGVEQIQRASRHRPANIHSEQHKAFCRKQLELIAKYNNVDFTEEKRHFEQMLQINL